MLDIVFVEQSNFRTILLTKLAKIGRVINEYINDSNKISLLILMQIYRYECVPCTRAQRGK